MLYNYYETNEGIHFSIGTEFEKITLLIDKEDLGKMKSFPLAWRIDKVEEGFRVKAFACTKGKSATIELAQYIMGTDNMAKIHHINNNFLDFRKDNLEIISKK